MDRNKKTREYSEYQLYVRDFKGQFSSSYQRTDEPFSSRDKPFTIDKGPNLNSTIYVNTAVEHQHRHSLESSASSACSSPQRLFPPLVDINSDEGILQAAIGLLALKTPYAVENTHEHPVNVAERSSEVLCETGSCFFEHPTSTYTDYVMPFPEYIRASKLFHR